jgi:hypothetical protein
VREIDDLPATVWWGVQVRQSSLHIAQCIARVQESCAALDWRNGTLGGMGRPMTNPAPVPIRTSQIQN